jgi:hypothetical protein
MGWPAVPEGLRTRLLREWEKVELLTTQIRALERVRRAAIRRAATPPSNWFDDSSNCGGSAIMRRGSS